MANLIRTLLDASEKSAQIARTWIMQDKLFNLLVEEKVGEEKNERFVQDFKTLADVLVQEVVRHDVLRQFPGMKGQILGEESNLFSNSDGSTIVVEVKENAAATANHLNKVLNNTSSATILANIMHKKVTIETDAKLEALNLGYFPENLGIWIDPIDGTAEYLSKSAGIRSDCGIISKGLPCATILIGVFDYNTGQSVAGVINQPFSQYDKKTKTWTGKRIWGIATDLNASLSHCLSTNPINNNAHELENPASSSDVASQSLSAVVSTSEDSNVKGKLRSSGIITHEIAAVGYKLLKVIDSTVDVYVLSKDSSFKWDSCAAHAILRGMGGGVVSYQKCKQVAMDCGLENTDKLLDKFRDLQHLYKNPDVELYEPGKKWSNSGGLIAFRTFDHLLAVITAIVK